MRIVKWGLAVLVVVFVTAVAAVFALGLPWKASGMAAKSLCSAAFVAGRDTADDLRAQDVVPASPILRLVSTRIDEQRNKVTARFLGVASRTASLTADRGCVLDLNPDPGAEPRNPTLESENAALLPRTAEPWPRGEAVLPEERWPGNVDAAGLNAVTEAALDEAGDPDGSNGRSVSIVQDGRLLVSRQAPGFTASTGLLGWSMAKTVTSMLLSRWAWVWGIPLDTPVVDAFPAGREPAWVEQWRADERARITLADLLYMRDGLDNDESYEPLGAVPQMLYGEGDMAGWAAEHKSAAPAGTRWSYLSASTNILTAVMRARFASDHDYWTFPRNYLFASIDARTARMETDTSGNWVGSSYVWASADDWARLGQLFLQDGVWNGRRVLPEDWVEVALAPAMDEGGGRGYGGGMWLIGDPAAGECRDVPDVPADTVAMKGHWGQLVAMVPSRRAVIVRMGWTVTPDQFDACTFVGDVLASLAD